jgi:poly-gamma-glutamate capsule biosynthesis protein CapA/YwtB (metallophosphatase superfamily)
MRIDLCGDISLWGKPENMILEDRGSQPFPGLNRLSNEADLFIANIECPLTDAEKPFWTYFKTLNASKAAGRFLRELGVNVGSLANNHIADYGPQGLEDTIAVLEEQGISWVGAGRSPEEARLPLILEKGGLKLGILALAQPEISASTRLGWGAGVLEDDYALNRMASLSKEVDIAIAYLHYGVEFSEYPTPHQVRLSRGLVDAGAKLVIGHHPHVPQGYEHYKDGFIAYSLGNFIFDMAQGPHKFSRLGLLVQANFENKRLKDVKIVPVDTRGGKTRLLVSGEKKEAEQYLKRLCEILADKEKLSEAYYFTCRKNFELYVKAFFSNVFRKRNWLQARDLVIQTFWPQIFELRKDLFRFLLSGEAIKIENSRKKPRGFTGCLWRCVCLVARYVGFPARIIQGLRDT